MRGIRRGGWAGRTVGAGVAARSRPTALVGAVDFGAVEAASDGRVRRLAGAGRETPPAALWDEMFGFVAADGAAGAGVGFLA